MQRWGRWLLIGATLVAVAGVGGLVWYHLPLRKRVYTDADQIRQPVARETPRDILWQPPARLSDALNTGEQDYEPRLSWDGLTLYFVRGKAGENADLYASKRTPEGWTEPAPLVEINGQHDELGPEPSPDGRSLYFYSDRPGGHGGYDIWVAHRGAQGWQAPLNLGPAVNSEFNDYGPAVAPDGAVLYFSSNRPRPSDPRQPDPDAWPATVREDLFQRTYDLYRSRLTEAGPQPAEAIAGLNTPYNEGAPCVSPAGDFVYFASDRPGGAGAFDLYRARRLGEAHQRPTNLGESVNTRANELDPGLTHLGYALYFSSDRLGDHPPNEQPPDYNLYYTSAREVFTETELQRRPAIDWAALWADAWPALLWLLLALMLLLLLRALMGRVRDRRLGLLAQCLVASLTAHALLMLLLSFWQVTASLSDALRRGRLQIALSTPGQADELTTQIRGQLTAFELPAAASIEAERAGTSPDAQAQNVLATLAITRFNLDLRERPRAKADAGDAPSPETGLNISGEPPAHMEPMTLPDIAVPAEARPGSVSEEPETPRVTPVAATFSEHGEIVLATSQPARRSMRATLPLRESATRDGSLDPASLARPAEPREARAQSPHAPPIETHAVRTQAIGLDVQVPHEWTRASAIEPLAQVPLAHAESTPTRATVPHRAERSLHKAAQARLAPQQTSTGVEPPQEPAVFEQVAQDYSPVTPRVLGPDAHVMNPVQAEPLDLTIAQLEQAAIDVSAEAAEHVSAALPTLGRASLAERAAGPYPRPGAMLVETTPPDDAGGTMSDTSPTPTAQFADAPGRSVQRTDEPRVVAGAPETCWTIELSLPNETEPPAEVVAQTGGPEDEIGEPPVGTIRGRVADAATGEPIEDATVRLDLPDEAPLIAKTDEHGVFSLPVPRLPDHVALSASHPDYVPGAENVPAWRLRASGLTQDFNLEPVTEDVIVIEDEPVVHHLGNDLFEGRINSQFQKKAEGRALRAYIGLSPRHLPPRVRSASISLLAKGVQCPHKIVVNGHLLEERLGKSPSDGSFGRFLLTFDADLLIEGVNTIEIQAVRCRGDLDDFELVNVQLHLSRR